MLKKAKTKPQPQLFENEDWNFPDRPQLDLQKFSDLDSVIKECFLIFEGTSKANRPYSVLVVKKKYSFDTVLITLFKRIGVTVLPHDSN